MQSEKAQVLVTVKASPEPSTKYQETVCVAGVRIDTTPPRLIRLYPVPFRLLTSDQQFRKYESIEVDLLPPRADKRPESYRINVDTLASKSKPLQQKRARGAILEPLIGPTMCALRAGVVEDRDATSLGIVETRGVIALALEKNPGWSERQQAIIERSVTTVDLFSNEPPPELQAPRFTVKYKYQCLEPGCKGHAQSILDWELSAFQWRYRADTDSRLKERITDKFLHEQCAPKLRVCFFVGNMASPVKRASFSVLGVYNPPKEADFGSTLF